MEDNLAKAISAGFNMVVTGFVFWAVFNAYYGYAIMPNF